MEPEDDMRAGTSQAAMILGWKSTGKQVVFLMIPDAFPMPPPWCLRQPHAVPMEEADTDPLGGGVEGTGGLPFVGGQLAHTLLQG